MLSQHEQKYDALARALGWDALKAMIPVPISEVRDALDAGDEHLNSIPIVKWDRAALGDPPKDRKCGCCGSRIRYQQPRHGCDGEMAKLFQRIRRGHSLSDGVCVLKHVAKMEANR